MGALAVIDWLMAGDPAIRWQVMRDLTEVPEEQIAAERARVAGEGWGHRLLALQRPHGHWPAGIPDFPSEAAENWWRALGPERQGTLFPVWTSTTWSLVLLRAFGVDPDSAAVRVAVGLVRDNVRWEHDGEPFFAGEAEPCINGRTVALGSYFGVDVAPVVERLLGEQMADGGWNCEQGNGSNGPATWTQFSFPPFWHYDVLRGLDHLRAAGVTPDNRVAEAIDLVRSKRDADGRWPLENPHPGKLHFAIDDAEGKPSRWNTLRAIRVLGWYQRAST